MRTKPRRSLTYHPKTIYHSKPEADMLTLTADPSQSYIVGGQFHVYQFMMTLNAGWWAEGTEFEYRGRHYVVRGTSLINMRTGHQANFTNKNRSLTVE